MVEDAIAGRARVRASDAPTTAEAWCWDQMSLSIAPASAGSEPFWARLEIRAEDGKDGPLFGRGSISESGISLTSLIELFSRPRAAQQSHWGPYELGRSRWMS